MKVKALFVKKIVEAAAFKANLALEYRDFVELSIVINEEEEGIDISNRYLYENMYNQSIKALNAGEEDIGLRKPFLNKVARFLGYKSFDNFVEMETNPPDSQLLECVGSWYSYVRSNSGLPHIFRAPVRIRCVDNRFSMELHGPQRKFTGIINRGINCMFVHLESRQEKSLHLVLKIGIARNPMVLKGVFSGVSTGGDPIAGKEVLVRQENQDFNTLTWKLVNMENEEDLKATDARIIDYFSNYHENCLKVSKVSTFILDDLI